MTLESSREFGEEDRIGIFLAQPVPEKIVAASAEGDSPEKIAEHQALWDLFTDLAPR